MLRIEVGIVKFIRFVAPENAYAPIEETALPSSNITDFKAALFANAYSPTTVCIPMIAPLEKRMRASFEHPSNACAPTVPTEPGMTISVKYPQLANA